MRFEPNDGHYLLTAGFDNTTRLWSGPRFRLLRTLAGHEGKVMGADVSPDGTFTVASTGGPAGAAAPAPAAPRTLVSSSGLPSAQGRTANC